MLNDEHEALQTIFFLEDCININHIPIKILKYKNHKSSKVRYLTSILSLLSFGPSSLESLFHDPSYLIRAFSLKYCKNLEILKIYLMDANSSVKLSVLEALDNLTLSEQDQNDLIINLLALINDKCLKIRLKLFDVLLKFNKISTETLIKMFDKEDIGTFIYAAEDESVEVRNKMINYMKKILSEESANVVFKFLCDMLNDDNENVRISVLKLIYQISKSYTLTKDITDLLSLLSLNKEKNKVFKHYLTKIVVKLKYSDFQIINDILKIYNNFDDLKIIFKIVKNNVELFKNQLKNIGMYIFTKYEERKNDNFFYLLDLMVLKVIGKEESIKLAQTDDSINILFYNEYPLDFSALSNVFKKTDLICDLNVLKTIFKKYKNIKSVKLELHKLKFNTHFVTQLKELILNIFDDPLSVYALFSKLDINHNRNFKFFNLTKKQCKISKSTDFQYLVKYLMSVVCYLLKNSSYCHFRDFKIKITDAFIDSTNSFGEIDLIIKHEKQNVENIYVILEKNNQKIKFDLKNRLKLTINEDITNSKLYIGYQTAQDMIDLTEKILIKNYNI